MKTIECKDMNRLLTINLFIIRRILMMYIAVPATTILEGMWRVLNLVPFARNIKNTKKIEKVLILASANFLSMGKPFTSKIILKNQDRNCPKRLL